MEIKKLRDIAIISAGQSAPQGDSYYTSEGVPFVKAGNLGELTEHNDENKIQKVSTKAILDYKLKLYPQGTIIFAKSGMSCLKGFVYVLKQDCYIVNHLACITPFDIESDYLKYYFEYHKPNKLIKDESYPSISLTDIGNMTIQLFNKDKRKEIVSKLNNLNNLISKNKEKLKKYEQLVKSQFIEMFGDVYSAQNNATHSIGDYVSDKTLKVSKLDNITNIKYIDISSINNQSNEITSYTEYNINERPSRAQQVVNKGDILISTVRPNLNNVAMVTDSFNNMVASTGFCIIKKNEQVNEHFIFTLVKNIEFANYLTKLTTGANYPAVNNKAILDFKIDLPPIELQNQFADFVKHIDKLKFSIKKSIEKLELCYKSLMQEYFG